MVDIVIKEHEQEENQNDISINTRENQNSNCKDTYCDNNVVGNIYDLFNLDCTAEFNGYDNDIDNEINFCDNDDSVALFYHYDTNYTVKSLKIIAQFYKLDTRKLKKDDLINSVIEFEMNNDNFYEVNERRDLWKSWKKLSNHKFFDTKLLEKI